MIKKYNHFLNEGLLDKLKGPTKEEVLQHYFIEKDEDNLLLSAIKFSSVEYIIKAIKMGADDYDALRMIIFDYEDVKLLEKFLDVYDINKVDYYDIIRLFEKNPNIEYKQIMINKITNINIFKDLIIYCAVNNLVRTFEMILYKHISGLNYDEVLVKACESGSNKIINLLLTSSNVDIHYNNDEALLNAVLEARTSTIKLLLEYGADIYARNGEILNQVRKYKLSGFATDMINAIKEKDYLNKL